MNKLKLGFIGIGLMGQPLTLRLLNAGYEVWVWNRSPDKLAKVVAAGAQVCAEIPAMLAQVDVVILCLADTVAVKTVIEEQFLISAAVRAQLLIDLSSIDPAITRELAVELKHKLGMDWVDAPVSGGTIGAEQGSLAVMAGGDAEAIGLAAEVLKPVYSRFTRMGQVGSGQITKICNQMIVSCNVLVIAEMMALAQTAGVDAAKIPEALAGGFADSKPLQIVGPQMANGCFEPVKWRVKTLLKDLNMAVDLAGKQDKSIPISGLAAQLMQLHASNGYAEQDPATLIQLYQPD